jgi:hypothetical protein
MLAKRYRIEELIGSGGYASVYRATDLNNSSECAIKEVMDPEAGVRKQFQLEAELLTRAKHPNIPNGYEVFEDRGRMYLVMEYIRGKDLEELLNESLVNRGRPLEEPQVLRWMIDICGALIEMHARPIPIIHRDIKPANIKITPEGRPVLIDFGLAKQQRVGNPTMTAAQGVSPGFAPPEQYMAKGRTDPRTDIYALGATLYACLTGKDPPEAPARLLAQTGAARTGGEVLLPVRKHNVRVSETTDRLVLKALELAPLQRQRSARELRDELRLAYLALSGAGSSATGAQRAVQTCARCGTQNRPDAAECVNCGALLPAAGETRRRPAIPPLQESGKRAAVAGKHASPAKNGAGRNGSSARNAAPAGVKASPAPPRPVIVPNSPSAAPNGWTGKQAAATADARTGQQAAVGRGTGKQPAAAVAARTGKQAAVGHGDFAAGGGTAGALALAPGRAGVALAPNAPARAYASAAPRVMAPGSAGMAASRPGRASRPWINLGDKRVSGFGKWVLAFSGLEVLWGATVLAAGVLVITRQTGTSLVWNQPPVLQFALAWIGVAALICLLGGQALSRPVYRRGIQANLRRGFQGTGLVLYTLVVHGVAIWGATIFATSQGNGLLATIAFLLFGINVLVVGILSVVNLLS